MKQHEDEAKLKEAKASSKKQRKAPPFSSKQIFLPFYLFTFLPLKLWPV